MSMIERIVKSKLDRHMPRNEIDRLLDKAKGGSESERIQAYLQLANVIVDLLPEPKPMRESYRKEILDCALSGIRDSSISVQIAAKLAAAYQLVHLNSGEKNIDAELRDRIVRLTEELEPFLRNRSNPANGINVESIRFMLGMLE